MRPTLLLAVWTLAACITGDDGNTDHVNWPEAWQAAVAECSPLCHWRVRCAGDVLETCETACEAAACGAADCSLPPSGADETIAECSHSLYLEAVSSDACAAEPAAYTKECRAAVMPARSRITWRDAVMTLCEPYCERAVQCGTYASLDGCVASCMDSLCDPDSCAPTYDRSWAVVDACAKLQLEQACPARDLAHCEGNL